MLNSHLVIYYFIYFIFLQQRLSLSLYLSLEQFCFYGRSTFCSQCGHHHSLRLFKGGVNRYSVEVNEVLIISLIRRPRLKMDGVRMEYPSLCLRRRWSVFA